MTRYLLSIDQGTTNSRAFIFSETGQVINHHEISLTQTHPQAGWTEQDPDEMWSNVLLCCQEALKKSNLSASQITAVGITNQRETTIIWDKKTGKPIYPAIVWHDRRTTTQCQQLKDHVISHYIKENTGLLIDPYFSATKIMWLLEHIPDARKKAENNELAFGTVDTFLVWKLTKGTLHATDATNASRTMLFNIKKQCWDTQILNALNIPDTLLPSVFNCSDDFGKINKEFLGSEIPITALIGDQQAATVGQACFQPGMIKSTYGTGCFVLLNTGEKYISSQHQLVTTIAYRLNNQVTYGLEGSVFSAGTIVKWLRDKLKIIQTAAESETLAQQVENTDGVYFVPAFSGLGAPYWNPHVRAAILGLTSNSDAKHIVRAALESVAYQTSDLLNAIANDYNSPLAEIRVDGGMSANQWLLQFIANLSQLPLLRPACIETTALGAAFLAGLGAGIYHSLDDIAALYQTDKTFYPALEKNQRDQLYQGWQNAIATVCR